MGQRGIDPTSPLYTLARLGRGRAYALQDQTPRARTPYEYSLALWKDAEPHIPILKQASVT